MADLAIPRDAHSPVGIHSERMDEGRWEGEGGGPIHKPLGVPEKSSEVPISDLAKDDVTAHTTASTEKSTAISGDSVDAASYDASKTHPTVVAAGEPGDPAKSKYHGASTLPVEGKDGEGEPKAAPARKKSISERLHEGWQDLKHKDLMHKGDNKDKDKK